MIIFFDIETIKDDSLKNFDKMQEKFWDKINFMPEFNKILCISVWRIEKWNAIGSVVKSLEWGEREQLIEFAKICKWNTLCGHNILWFDIPFIIKRMAKHKITIPNELKVFWKKPWEINHIDTLKVWQCWVFWTFWSMDLICIYLWLMNPKEQWIDWSQVQEFHDEWKDDEIREYCNRDTQSVINLYNYFKEYNLI